MKDGPGTRILGPSDLFPNQSCFFTAKSQQNTHFLQTSKNLLTLMDLLMSTYTFIVCYVGRQALIRRTLWMT